MISNNTSTCQDCGGKLKYYDKVMTYATAFCMVSAGVLMLAFVPSAIGIRQTQKAQAFNLMADGHRMLGLAKSYDAKAAAIALKTVTSEVL